MIKVMDKINNHFMPIHNYPEYRNYEIVVDGIVGNFTQTYIPGMYVVVRHSILNDGIYKITGVTHTKLTVDETLVAENTGQSFIVVASTPPKVFVDLATEIENFTESGVGLKSESIDDYSASFKSDGSWESVYSEKLAQYRKLFDDISKHPLNCRW